MDLRLEAKLGFDRIRSLIADRCSTDYASQRVALEQVVTDPSAIRRRLLLTDEMRLVMMFEENFPANGYIDCTHYQVYAPLKANSQIKATAEFPQVGGADNAVKFDISPIADGRATVRATYKGKTKTFLIN